MVDAAGDGASRCGHVSLPLLPAAECRVAVMVRPPVVLVMGTKLLLVLLSGAAAGGRASRLVTTEYGQLQGYLRSFQRHQVAGGPTLRPVNVFLGVPYATPPLGSNRFSPTRTPAPWSGVRSASRAGPVCPQKLPPDDPAEALRRMPRVTFERVRRLRAQLKNQSEDCLYLNVYAPAHRKLGTCGEWETRNFQVGLTCCRL